MSDVNTEGQEATSAAEQTAPALTAEEQSMIAEARQRNISPSELISRASRDYHREHNTDAAASPEPEGDAIPTVADVDRRVAQALQHQNQENHRESFKKEIQKTIGQVIESDGRYSDDPADRRQILSEVVRTVQEKGAAEKLSGEAFFEAVREATAAEIQRRSAKAGKVEQGRQREDMDKRLSAAKNAGEAGGGAGRSGGQGSTAPSMESLSAHEMEFGPNTNWPSDAQIEAATEKEADAFLKKARSRA